MARLGSMQKMGYYPTPDETISYIAEKITCDKSLTITTADPCCGTGEALRNLIKRHYPAYTYGIEIDIERYKDANYFLDYAIHGSIFDTIIKPLECFSMLYLNPPYDFENGERMEYLFLKESFRWLKKGGLLIYIIPEYILISNQKIINFIKRRFKEIQIFRITKEDYPTFKQIILFGIKRDQETEEELNSFPLPPYEHIEDDKKKIVYTLPEGIRPDVFEIRNINEDIISAYQETAMKNILEALKGKETEEKKILSPIFMLKKGHIFQLLMSGAINGLIKKKDEELVFKCHTTRIEMVTEDEEVKKIKNTYIPNIRIIKRGEWHDIY